MGLEMTGDEQLAIMVLMYPNGLHDGEYSACIHPGESDRCDELANATGNGQTALRAAIDLFAQADRKAGSDEPPYIVSEIDTAMMPESPYVPPPRTDDEMAAQLRVHGYIVIAPKDLDTWRYVGGPCPTCSKA